MSEHGMPANGEFCWNELATADAEAAKKFYAGLFGWEYKTGDVEGVAYNEIVVNGRPIGGIHQMGAEFGTAPPHWMGYVAVGDVDASARMVEELGGKVCVPPTDIPKVGRFCVINDPTGATMSLITLSPHE
ncbi:MAG TPA: VOC family protein [Pyrinomonadaceae bacterium]|nr:VOC family protein [Pyrinomonadaceae bacterium]